MRAAFVAGGIAALALVACRTTQGDATTKTDVVAPMASAPVAAADVDAGAASADAGARQTARFHLTPSTKGRQRRFAPGVAVQRIDDGGATAVTLDPPGDDTSNGTLATATPLTPGHYRANFLVATCAAESPDGGCKSMSPKPDDVEFDVPASGDIDVDVK